MSVWNHQDIIILCHVQPCNVNWQVSVNVTLRLVFGTYCARISWCPACFHVFFFQSPHASAERVPSNRALPPSKSLRKIHDHVSHPLWDLRFSRRWNVDVVGLLGCAALRNVNYHLQDYTAAQPRKLQWHTKFCLENRAPETTRHKRECNIEMHFR
jgi:hypothetical protein